MHLAGQSLSGAVPCMMPYAPVNIVSCRQLLMNSFNVVSCLFFWCRLRCCLCLVLAAQDSENEDDEEADADGGLSPSKTSRDDPEASTVRSNTSSWRAPYWYPFLYVQKLCLLFCGCCCVGVHERKLFFGDVPSIETFFPCKPAREARVL